MRGSRAETHTERRQAGARGARGAAGAGKPFGCSQKLLEIAVCSQIGTEDGVQKMRKTGRIRWGQRHRQAVMMRAGRGAGRVPGIEVSEARRRRHGRGRLFFPFNSHLLHDVLELGKLFLLGFQESLCIGKLRLELVILAVHNLLLGSSLLFCRDNHLVRFLEKGGRKIFQLLFNLLLLLLHIETSSLLFGNAGKQTRLLCLDRLPSHPHVACKHFPLLLHLGLEVVYSVQGLL